MAITSYKAVVGYYNGAGTPSIITAVTGQLADGWLPIGAPILTDSYGQCTQMMVKTDATPAISTSAYTVVTAANPQPPDATWDAQGEPLWVDTTTYLQAYTKGGVYLQGTVDLAGSNVTGTLPVTKGGTGANDTTTAWINLGGGSVGKLNTVTLTSDVTGILPKVNGGTGNSNGTVATLTTSRTFITNLASSTAASFNGSSNVSQGVTGVLPITNGGTGSNNAANAWDNLGGGSIGKLNAVNLQANVTGVLQKVNGGTGTTTGSLMANAGGQVGILQSENNMIRMTNVTSVSPFDYSNFAEGYWYNGYWKLGAVRGASTALDRCQLQVADGAGTSTNFLFFPNGTAQATNWQSTSDIRLKTNVQRIDDPLSKMRQIKGVTWERLDKSPKPPGIGFIAQDVQTVFPDSVSTIRGYQEELIDGTIVDEPLAVDVYGVAAALHHEAILALMDKVEALEALLKSGK